MFAGVRQELESYIYNLNCHEDIRMLFFGIF